MNRDLLDYVCARYADAVGTCPFDMHGYRAMDCEKECRDTYPKCWRMYFVSEYERIKAETERIRKAVER